jgi:hypothetical protein
MGWRYQRRIRTGKNSWINLSKRGASASFRIGPATFNSRGRSSFRVARGLSYRSGCALPMTLTLRSTALVVFLFVRLLTPRVRAG